MTLPPGERQSSLRTSIRERPGRLQGKRSGPEAGVQWASASAIMIADAPLGPIDTWPQSLRGLVDLMLGTRQPVCIAWGPALTSLYNDG